MEPNSLQGGMYSAMGSGMLGLEMSLHHHPPPQSQPQQNPPNPSYLGQNANPHMSAYPHQEPNPHPSLKPNYPFPLKSKAQQLTISDEDEPGLNTEDINGDGKRKMNSSPWQRMKWTDSMVRLLILVVYYTGDESGSEGADSAVKKKVGAGAGGVVLQKKGKWKSVSRAMLERGFYVSPQQCEDKFNDLNKRYKRVNDILGKGTACRVVENQSLLETMDLSAKKKEEVKKLLNSKHLFFREMCAYHTSCAAAGGGGAGGTSSGLRSPEVVADATSVQQHHCLHSSENATIGSYLNRNEGEELKMVKGGNREEEDNEDDEDDGDEDEDDEDGHEDEDNNGDDDKWSKKRARAGGFFNSPLVQQLNTEVTSLVQDRIKSPWEKQQWMKNQMLQLEEKRVSFQLEAFELEKQKLRWVKFSSKKEREMERKKLVNQRMRLENERMLLLLQQKEFELLDLQQQHQKRTSSLSG